MTATLRQHPGVRPCPTPDEAELLARELLQDVGTRWPHVRAAGLVAAELAILFGEADARLLRAAAVLHDIGYSPRIADTGFHPLDGAVFLTSRGFPHRLGCLVAHHSWAILTAPLFGVDDLALRFPDDRSLLSDALTVADMCASPDGRIVDPADRLADILVRHGHPIQDDRALFLRASIARVSGALRSAGHALSLPLD